MSAFPHGRVARRRSYNRGVLMATVLLACAGALADRAAAASPGAVTPPDLRIFVPTNLISIGVDPSSGARELRFTHITADVGAGPFEIDPSYDSRTGTSTFVQAIYRSPSPGTWVLDHKVPIAAVGQWHPPSDYQFPLTAFTLDRVNPDGSPGAVVATSPKTDYCITGDTMVPDVPNTPNQTFISPGNCGDPTAPLGWSVGWGDEYDQTDAGQPIDLTGVPDGTYILHAVVDPRHVFTESNTTNDVTDTKLVIGGDSVTVLSQTTPGSSPPSISLTSPRGGSLGGAVTLQATATAQAPATVSSVQFLLDGHRLGPVLGTPPYRYVWATNGAGFGRHWLSAEVSDSQGDFATASPVQVTIPRPPPLRVRRIRWRRGVLTLALASLPRGAVVEAALGFAHSASRGLRLHRRMTRARTARPRTITLTMMIAGHRRGGMLTLHLNEPPTVSIANPARGEIVSGIQPIAADASGGSPIAFAQFSVDGRRLGRALTTRPYATRWDTRRLRRGRHILTVWVVDVAGHSAQTHVAVTVENPAPPMTCFVMQAQAGARGQGTATTHSFATALPGETLLALVSADGPSGGRQSASVSGGGLRWHLVARANRSSGDSEIWAATAWHPLHGAQVRASLAQGSYNLALTVVAMEGADGVGAASGASGASAGAALRLKSLSPTSLIFAVGNDWSQASARTLRVGWVFLNQTLDAQTGDTFWAQTTNHPTGPAGSSIDVEATGPPGDQWNLAAVELINSDR